MKIIPFPGGGVERPDEAWLTELEAALDGSAEGPRADSWRELRGDVRALAPPISPEFERELSKRIADRSARASRPAALAAVAQPQAVATASSGRTADLVGCVHLVPRSLPSRWRLRWSRWC